jgi:hypothetical protein
MPAHPKPFREKDEEIPVAVTSDHFSGDTVWR